MRGHKQQPSTCIVWACKHTHTAYDSRTSRTAPEASKLSAVEETIPTTDWTYSNQLPHLCCSSQHAHHVQIAAIKPLPHLQLHLAHCTCYS